MKKILVIGAGRSSSDLIRHLVKRASLLNWRIRVGDRNPDFAAQKMGHSSCAEAFIFDVFDEAQRQNEIKSADLVISMLPAQMHFTVAKDCIHFGKSVITPSYVSDEMWQLDAEARKRGVLILNEMGVDPGIDHMSAMKMIHAVQSKGGILQRFESFTGGLMAPESDNNPWNYKVTWNPRNVVLAGYGGTARFRQENEFKYIPYHRLFERMTEVEIKPYGVFEGYANRDSLKYMQLYGLEKIPTLYRGTLRRKGFSKAWNVLVQIGMTDDSFQIENLSLLSWRELTASFLDCTSKGKVEETLRAYWPMDDDTFFKLQWLGIFENKRIELSKGSPAQALQCLIEEKWQLEAGDLDMLVMWHRILFLQDKKLNEWQSSLITIGEDAVFTAMSKTVGMPMAIVAEMILQGKITLTGVQLPVVPEIYLPVLEELEKHGIVFTEQHQLLSP